MPVNGGDKVDTPCIFQSLASKFCRTLSSSHDRTTQIHRGQINSLQEDTQIG